MQAARARLAPDTRPTRALHCQTVARVSQLQQALYWELTLAIPLITVSKHEGLKCIL